MNKQIKQIIIAIIMTIILCAVVGIAFLGPSAIFFWCMLTDDGGKLDNAEEAGSSDEKGCFYLLYQYFFLQAAIFLKLKTGELYSELIKRYYFSLDAS